MHFFSRYSYIWRFPGDQEQDYARFVMPGNLISLRLVSFITIFGMCLFLTIDFFREVNYSIVFATRLIAVGVGAVTMYESFRRELSIRLLNISIASLAAANFGVAMVTATFANVPSFYLTNLLFLIFVLVVTASGLNFRHSLLMNTALLMVFIFFSQYIRKDPFYVSQYPHLFATYLYIQITGLVLESRRRLNFLNFTELTKQKRLVENLNEQKIKIISILSHDIASPLNSLSGLLNLQSKGFLKPEELTPFVSEVGLRLENVHSLLQSLVRWSHSQMEGFVPDKKEFDVVELARQTAEQFTKHAAEKSIHFIMRASEVMQITGDKDMVQLVFRNIISNAIKFGYPNTSMVVEIQKKSPAIVLISFTNEGIPISAKQREKLFSYQVHSTQGTSGEKGTGLGLAMSAYFVKLNEGQIYLSESTSGRTVFCVELPAATDVSSSTPE